MKGIKRFRQAIKNQRDAGEGEFHLNYHDAEEIADEIDAELLGICSSAERETGRYAWAHGIPAPKDADGNVVPITTLQMYDDDGNCGKINCYDSFFYNQALIAWFVGTDLVPEPVEVASLHLNRPDSWERLEEDVQKVSNEGTCSYFGAKACDDSCPAKCTPVPCSTCALKDAMRRAKALAGRGED